VIVDLWIAFTGLTALALLLWGGTTERRWAPFIGLAGQPAWFAHAIDSGSSGVIVMTVAYALMWAAGCVKELRA
jgi:hypothetical protein